MAWSTGSKFGTGMAGIGLFILGYVIVLTGAGLWGGTKGCPTFTSGPSGAAVWIYAPGGGLRLGRPACLNVKPAFFFAKERAALDQAEKEFRAAEAAVAGMAPSATDAQRTAAATRLASAQTALQQAPRRRKVFLYLDDVKVPMDGREVEVRSGSKDRPWVRVDMPLRGAEDAASDDGRTWRKILSGPTDYGVRPVRVSVAVGEADDRPPTVRAVLSPQAVLRVFHPGRLVVGSFGLLLLAFGVATAGWKTGLLRDGGAGTPFSLGRVQMGWWLVLTVAGFLFIWLVSGQWKGVITAGVIGLLGISASTGVAARLVDTRVNGQSPPEPSATSKSFWSDIVSDGDGPALHRLQLIAWTVLLGAVFVWTVLWTFGFPDFDTNLLLLAGIAGGTYLGFKFQETDLPGSPPH